MSRNSPSPSLFPTYYISPTIFTFSQKLESVLAKSETLKNLFKNQKLLREVYFSMRILLRKMSRIEMARNLTESRAQFSKISNMNIYFDMNDLIFLIYFIHCKACIVKHVCFAYRPTILPMTLKFLSLVRSTEYTLATFEPESSVHCQS